VEALADFEEVRQRRGASQATARSHEEVDVTLTIEFMRVRERDNAHATLDRVSSMSSDLDEVKARAKALFATLDLPQRPDALRILDEEGRELFFWSPVAEDS
jgi:hypothetical protein